jgi:glycosyltransferase involved in cell wall biosynthesis
VGRYVHARALLARLLGLAPGEAGPDAPVMPRVDDLFVGLDLVRDHAAPAAPALDLLREGGVRVAFVLYDVLPLRHPEWFPDGMQARFADWLRLVAARGDRVACISRHVADEAAAAFVQLGAAPPRLGVFPLGNDLQALVPARRRLPIRSPGATRFLMVGTIEPRKGHAQALDAFERLWSRNAPVELAIAGRAGWRVEALLDRLASHPERGLRLHWIEAADDAELLAAYGDCDALIAASLDEGYGLPLVEAAALGRPVLARDVPVFREVAGEGADYFRGEDGEALAAALEDWIARRARGATADPARVPGRDWRASATALAAELMRD